MFDFEKLEVYRKAKVYQARVAEFLEANRKNLDRVSLDQWRRASMSIVLNIAEGTSRFSKADKKNFYTIARGLVFECIAICDILNVEGKVTKEARDIHYAHCEELSKMLFALIKRQDAK